METLFIELAKQAPTSVVSLIVVYMFLKHLKERDENISIQLKERDDSIAELNRKRDETATRICVSLDRNSECLTLCEASHRRLESLALSRDRANQNKGRENG